MGSFYQNSQSDLSTVFLNKEDRAEGTLGILIKIPHKNPLDLSPIWLGRIKMFSKFIFLCLQNMVSGQQVGCTVASLPNHPQSVHTLGGYF